MKTKQVSTIAIGFVAVIVLYGMSGQSPSGLPMAQQNSQAAEESGESLDVRYARTYLKLARVELRKVLDANEKIPATYSAALTERLRQNVTIAEEQLQQARLARQGDVHKVHLRDAEAAVKFSELRLKQAQAVNHSNVRISALCENSVAASL